MSEQTQRKEYTEQELEEKPYLSSPLLLHDLERFDEPKALRFDLSDKFLAVVGNGTSYVLDVRNNFRLMKTFPGHSSTENYQLFLPSPLDWSEDGTRLLISAPNLAMQIINISTFEPVHSEDISLDSQQHKAAPVCCAAFRPSCCSRKPEFACGDKKANMKIVGDLDAEKPKVIHDLQHHNNSLTCLRYSSSGSRLYTGSCDLTILESDAENGYVKLRQVIKLPSGCSNFSDTFGAEGERISVATWYQRRNHVINLKEGKVESEYPTTENTLDVCITHHSKNSRREPFIFLACVNDYARNSGHLRFTDVKGNDVAEAISMGGEDCYCLTTAHNNKMIALGHTGNCVVILRPPFRIFSPEDRIPAFKLRMLSKGKIWHAFEIYNVTVLVALFLA